MEGPVGTRPPCRRTARELAIAFRRDTQSEVDLIRWRVPCNWVQRMYPIFCQAESAIDPQAWKDFAHELDAVMPKKRTTSGRTARGCAHALTTWCPILPPPWSNLPITSGPSGRAAQAIEPPPHKRLDAGSSPAPSTSPSAARHGT